MLLTTTRFTQCSCYTKHRYKLYLLNNQHFQQYNSKKKKKFFIIHDLHLTTVETVNLIDDNCGTQY